MTSSLVAFTYGVSLLLLLVTVVAAGYWVYSDATTRGSASSLRWGVFSVLCFPIGIYYLIHYRRAHERVQTPTHRSRIAGLVAMCGVQAVLIAALFAPSDPFSQSGFTVLSFVVLLPVYRYLLF